MKTAPANENDEEREYNAPVGSRIARVSPRQCNKHRKHRPDKDEAADPINLLNLLLEGEHFAVRHLQEQDLQDERDGADG